MSIASGVKGLFGGKPGVPELPEASKPQAVMPTSDDAAVSAARRRTAAQRAKSSGRLSTILTGQDGQKLGA